MARRKSSAGDTGGDKARERRLARALHCGFYALILAAAASSASSGGFVVPNVTGPDALLESWTKFVPPGGPRPSNHRSVKRGFAWRACAIQVTKGASMFAILFRVTMNESRQIGAGPALETRYRTID
jgi:hypothetical protein